jgi:hypothetical protein
MTLNPETLAEDSREEREERQRRTGSIGTGLHVICTPKPEEPEVSEIQHRVVCMTKPYPSCHTCAHGRFTLVFNVTPNARLERVLCPRWSGAERQEGKNPEEYIETEVATCQEKPFEFCPSCPSREALQKLGIDKLKDGWYSRWRRFTEEEPDE